MTIVNDDSCVINKLETSLTDNARVVIYDHHMFIVQATGNTNRRGRICTVDLLIKLGCFVTKGKI